ncbi:DUF397 domain-containing protein [Streptomyces sp. AV19]|uniref:DUF397 domain-containing protein n=1 Tax=Streptomyces sp. AV19 TaxID=2793068 RepID=UPI0018FEF492|nr:DUF397 domain-containing protein [Streptomyces sp. AV19]MBH1937065.1 DUF397 domain-containing protein [Streptomyces sp. AV19]MDG4535904.1 DUF397 domain-containing protein [Streptomyces sp. AV19]
MSASAISGIRWAKSSYCGGDEGECVEFARAGAGLVPVRDSKSPHRAALGFSAPSWAAFTAALGEGSFRP